MTAYVSYAIVNLIFTNWFFVIFDEVSFDVLFFYFQYFC
jgi:hypothetical protein